MGLYCAAAMVVGMTRTTGDVWIATLAILGHKGAEAVALASAFLKAGGVRTPEWNLHAIQFGGGFEYL